MAKRSAVFTLVFALFALVQGAWAQTEVSTAEQLNSAISKDRWFDVQGRQLKAKPSIKGRYLHNGRIEVVK